jgi:Fur family ferric uptake transcriptional regulator
MQASEFLKLHQIKNTKIRSSIVDLLITEKKPLTSREIIERLNHTCDEATVFRSLKLFKSKEIVQVSYLKDSTAFYQLQHQKHQHNVVCTDCGKVESLSACGIGPMIKAAKDIGFTNLAHRIEIFGQCSQCHA